jgi:hypothetical protein
LHAESLNKTHLVIGFAALSDFAKVPGDYVRPGARDDPVLSDAVPHIEAGGREIDLGNTFKQARFNAREYIDKPKTSIHSKQAVSMHGEHNKPKTSKWNAYILDVVLDQVRFVQLQLDWARPVVSSQNLLKGRFAQFRVFGQQRGNDKQISLGRRQDPFAVLGRVNSNRRI